MLQHFVAKNFFLELLEDLLGFDLPLDFALGNRRDELFQRLVDAVVIFELAPDPHRLGERHHDFFFHFAVEVVADLLLGDRQLLLSRVGRKRVDRGNDLLDRFVRRVERLDNLIFRHFLRPGLHHHEPVFAAGDNQVELAVFALLEGGVDQVLTVDEPHANAGNRFLERDLRERERGGGTGDREDVRVVLLIRRQNKRDDLRLEAPAGWEQRPDRPVDAAAREHFLFRRLAFAFEEAAGDPSRRVGVFTIVHGQRQEVDSFARVGGAACRHEDDRVAEADDDGAAGLLGELSRFEPERVIADGDFASIHRCSEGKS